MKNIFSNVIDKIKNNLRLFLSIMGVVVILAGVVIYNSYFEKPINTKPVEENQETTSQKQNFLDSSFYSSILLAGQGNKNTGKYVVVLSDYSCGWSAKFYQETIKPFLAQKNLDKIWMQYDFLILNEQSPSLLPTEAAYCANEYNRFWEFHDGVFALKNKYETVEEAFTEENIVSLAKSLNIYEDQFKQCMSEHKYKELILMRANYYLDVMERLGVPSTFLNGYPITLLIEGKEQAVGAIDINTFNKKINEWLAGD